MSGARRHARRCALQVLYQCEFGGVDPERAIAEFEADAAVLVHADRAWFARLVRGAVAHREELDAALEPCLSRPLPRLDPMVRVLLRLGLYEICHCPEVPWKAVIDEAVELAHEFGNDNAYRFVNAVLDRAHGGRGEVAAPES